jgi:hypothetical protein
MFEEMPEGGLSIARESIRSVLVSESLTAFLTDDLSRFAYLHWVLAEATHYYW